MVKIYDGFNVKYGLCSFKRYPHFNEEWILESFIREMQVNKLPIEAFNLFKIAWNSRFWETKGYDGATAVKDSREPRLDNFIHDYCYRLGYVNDKVDVIYRELMLLTGYSKFKAYRRYYVIKLVRPYFKLKKINKGEYKINSVEIEDLYLTLKTL